MHSADASVPKLRSLFGTVNPIPLKNLPLYPVEIATLELGIKTKHSYDWLTRRLTIP